MDLEEIKPHLNKVSTLYLKDNKRKVGFVFLEDTTMFPSAVTFCNVLYGKKFIHKIRSANNPNMIDITRQSIPVENIVRIRSIK